MRHLIPLLLVLAGAASVHAAEINAASLTRQMAAQQNQPSTVIRMRLESPGSGTLQLQARERRSGGETTVLYRVLWPKEREGEALLLTARNGRFVGGARRAASGESTKLTAADLRDGLFGSDLALADLVENFYGWKDQTITGEETINGVKCVVIESRPGGGDASIYGAVRSWVDPNRRVPLVVEKLGDSGRPLRRIEGTRIVRTGAGFVPADLSIEAGGRSSRTRIVGSSIRHDVPVSAEELSVTAAAPAENTR